MNKHEKLDPIDTAMDVFSFPVAKRADAPREALPFSGLFW